LTKEGGNESLLVGMILIGVVFAALLILATTFSDATVSNNFVTGARQASGFIGIILLIAMVVLVKKYASHASGKSV